MGVLDLGGHTLPPIGSPTSKMRWCTVRAADGTTVSGLCSTSCSNSQLVVSTEPLAQNLPGGQSRSSAGLGQKYPSLQGWQAVSWLSCRLGTTEGHCGKARLTGQLPRWLGCGLDMLISVQHQHRKARPNARPMRRQSSLRQVPGPPAGKVAHDLCWVGQILGQETASRAELPVSTGLAPSIVLVSSMSGLHRLLSNASLSVLLPQHARRHTQLPCGAAMVPSTPVRLAWMQMPRVFTVLCRGLLH